MWLGRLCRGVMAWFCGRSLWPSWRTLTFARLWRRCGFLSGKLRSGAIRPDDQGCGGYFRSAADMKSEVTICVDSVGNGEAFSLPVGHRGALRDALPQHFGVAEARQIQVPGERLP